MSKPIDKRIYKGTQPTCHDFNHLTATAESVSLLVGFSAGQVQLIDPIKKETSKLFNEEVCLTRSLDIFHQILDYCVWCYPILQAIINVITTGELFIVLLYGIQCVQNLNFNMILY